MVRKTKLEFKNLAEYRKQKNLNQSKVWSRFGVTQSGGSRYEAGRGLPKSVAMLIWLLEHGEISEENLQNALSAARK